MERRGRVPIFLLCPIFEQKPGHFLVTIAYCLGKDRLTYTAVPPVTCIHVGSIL